MNRRTLGLLLVCCMLVLPCGCRKRKKIDVEETTLAPKPVLPEPAGGIVLSIDSTAITADELIAPVKPHLDELAAQHDYVVFRKNAKKLLGSGLMQKIADIKLYQKAKDALPENVDEAKIDQVVEQEVQSFIARYGGNYATVEQMLKQMGITWQDLHEQQRKAILIQSFISEETKVDKPITHSELLQYYDSIKEGLYGQEPFAEFRVIDLNVDKFADANNPSVTAGHEAIAFAQQLIEQIKNGADFAELAQKYSQDASAQNGGLWKPVRPGSLIEPYNSIETAVENMDAGEVSEPIIAGGHIFIVKLENKQAGGYEPFEKVQTEVEGRLVIERRQEMIDQMLDKIMSQVDLSYAENFLEYCVQKAWLEAGKVAQNTELRTQNSE